MQPPKKKAWTQQLKEVNTISEELLWFKPAKLCLLPLQQAQRQMLPSLKGFQKAMTIQCTEQECRSKAVNTICLRQFFLCVCTLCHVSLSEEQDQYYQPSSASCNTRIIFQFPNTETISTIGFSIYKAQIHTCMLSAPSPSGLFLQPTLLFTHHCMSSCTFILAVLSFLFCLLFCLPFCSRISFSLCSN